MKINSNLEGLFQLLVFLGLLGYLIYEWGSEKLIDKGYQIGLKDGINIAFERGFEEGEYSICQDIISKEKQGFVRPGTSSQTCVDLAIKKLNERQAEIDENNASMQEYQQNKY